MKNNIDSLGDIRTYCREPLAASRGGPAIRMVGGPVHEQTNGAIEVRTAGLGEDLPGQAKILREVMQCNATVAQSLDVRIR